MLLFAVYFAILLPLNAVLVAIDGPTSRKADNAVLIADLTSADWDRVEQAKLRLESAQAAAVPELIALLDREDVVPLVNTGDLIYPGAKQFYGHGFMVDYDLDRIAVRAGWVLEEMTFQDFGFSEGSIREADLLQATIKGKRDVPLREVVPETQDTATREQRRTDARRRAKEWWTSGASSWTRFAALTDALSSGNEWRQMKTLGWLRYGTTRCDGLSQETYSRQVLPIVKKLASSSSKDVREQAKELKQDHEGWWWKYKTENPVR